MRGEVGESYWGGACDLLCIFGFGAFQDESTEKKIMVIGWELWEVGDFWNSSTEKRREKLLLVGWELWEVGEFNNFWGESLGWVLRHEGEHKEERRREMRWEYRGEETKFLKKSWSVGPSTVKKVDSTCSILLRNCHQKH